MQSQNFDRLVRRCAWLGRNRGLPLAEREMRLLIDLERERSDRGGGPFAVVEVQTEDHAARHGGSLSPRRREHLARELTPLLRRRLRRIDTIGELGGRIAVLMPNTDEHGARKAMDDVLATAVTLPRLVYFVSVYPTPRPQSRARPAAAGRAPGMVQLSVAGSHAPDGAGAVATPAVVEPLPPALQQPGRAWKRALDLIGATGMLIGLAPLLGGCVLYLQLRDPGPVLFRQRRIGWQGRPFTMLKLRTMRVGADQGQHQRHLQALMRSNQRLTKLDSSGDPRVIPGVGLIRKLGIDELPQLINVVRGEMSLVGPRPCLPYEAQALIQWQQARFKVRPGLTGAWQVNGKNQTTFRRMLELDVGYTHAPRLWSDLLILLRTPPAVIGYARKSAGPGGAG